MQPKSRREGCLGKTERNRTCSKNRNGTIQLLNIIKRFVSALCLSGLVSDACGQGLVRLQNSAGSLVSLAIPGNPNWPPGGSLLFGLLTAPAGSTDIRRFTITGGVLATNLAVAGRVGGGTVAVPGWQPGETRAFAIVGWSASLGTNFNPAWLAEGCISGLGVSEIGSGRPGGLEPGTGLYIPPLSPFQVLNSGLVLYGPLSPEFCPAILTPPLSQSASVGSTVTFTVTTYTLEPTYQWHFNGLNLVGETNRILVLPNVQPWQAGAYSVTVSGGPPYHASVSSSLAMLVVGVPVTISTHPQSQTADAGSTVELVVSASGSPPLAYYWFFNETNLPSGGTNSVLELPDVQSAQSGKYTVVVTNAFGAVTSSPAVLTVIASSPTILRSPRDQTAFLGWSVDLTLSSRGTLPLGYQWFFNGNIISGANQANLHLANLQFSQSGTYTVTVTNAFGAVTSAPAVLTVIARPPKPPAGIVVGWGDPAVPYVAPGTRFKAIAAGSLHSLAIKLDGTVVAWGANGGGQSTVPAGLSNVIAIAGGGYGLPGHSLALKSDGKVTAWGGNGAGQLDVPSGLDSVIDVAAGMETSLALKSNGTVVAWGGANYVGQTNVPPGLNGVIAISAGGYHCLALKSDGAVVAWGDNSWDQTNVPAGLSGVTAVAAAYLHSLALKSDGTIVSWGGYGQTNVPVGLNGVIAIAAKGDHGLALKSDGTVVAIGGYDPPANFSNVVAIAAGEAHNLALKSDGTVVAWGSNEYSQTMVPGALRGVIVLASGGWMGGHDLALMTEGTVVAWGRIACQTSSWLPANLSDVIALAAGECHGLALKSDGALVAWGSNWAGQTNVPAGLRNVLAIATGGSHSLAVQSDGTVVAWGSDNDQSGNFAGQSTVPSGLSDATALAGGEHHSLALKSDDTVVAWGSNKDNWGDYAGQSLVPAGLNGVVAIAAGGFHSLALTSNGVVVAWGNDTFGQCQVPVGLNGAVAIAAGQYHSLALRSDGTVVSWGESSSSTVPVALPRVLGIFAGGLRSLAIVAEPPSILTKPASQTAEAGSTTRFRVHDNGYPPPFYLWYLNDTNFISGSTNCELVLTDVQFSQIGTYTLVISNALGAVTSAPAMLSVIPPVERRWVPALTLSNQPGNALNLDATSTLAPTPNWVAFDSVILTNSSQWYFDLSAPLPLQRFYRAWHTSVLSPPATLDLHMVPVITLTGSIGSSVRLDYINQFGPTDAWVTLDTVTPTNSSQLYFDTSAIGQPPRLWRIVPVP